MTGALEAYLRQREQVEDLCSTFLNYALSHDPEYRSLLRRAWNQCGWPGVDYVPRVWVHIP